MKTVSVIVPCFNQADYLSECLESVYGQSFSDWECIIVDDGSTDHSARVAELWCRKDNRFTYYRIENSGVSAARNYGISKAEGLWILPLDADDIIADHYLERAAKEFNKNYQVIYCNARFFGLTNEEWNQPAYSHENLLLRNPLFCSSFFKKEDWKKIDGYDSNLKHGLEDWEFWIRLLGYDDSKVKKLSYCGFFYRRKETSRDTEINANEDLLFNSELYIYTKHKKLYQKYKSPQRVIKRNLELEYHHLKFSRLLEKARGNKIYNLLLRFLNK